MSPGGERMPVTYEMDVARRRILMTARGVIAMADFMENRLRLRADPRRTLDMDVLVDLSQASTFHVTTPEVWALAWERDPSPVAQGTRVAVVAPAPEAFGLSRLYEQARGGRASEVIQVFRTLAEAEAWLGSPRL